MIYTITFNPSLDYIMHIDFFMEGETNRSFKEEYYVGGKGINVSTILSRLSMESIALGFVSGFVGKEITKQVLSRGIKSEFIQLENEVSRINIKLKGKVETEINGNGPVIDKQSLERLMKKLDKIEDGDVLVLAGSIPSSVPKDIYEKIMVYLKNRNIHIVVDATGDLLLKVLSYHPFLIKPNLSELEGLFDVHISSLDELVKYGLKLKGLGAQNVLISLGKDGALLVSDDLYYCAGVQGVLVNSVGSGDSMVAGFIAGYMKSDNVLEALKLGCACGCANAFCEDLATLDMINEVYKDCHVVRLCDYSKSHNKRYG